MRIGCRSVALATALAAVLAFGTAAHALNPANSCDSGKAKLAGKTTAALLGCYSKASGKGLAIDSNCTTKATSKFHAGSLKLDGKQVPPKAPLFGNVCHATTPDDVPSLAEIQAYVDDVANDLDPKLPGTPTRASSCTAGKLKCAGKKDAAILGCKAKALSKGLAIDANCTTKASSKFTACYGKLETKEVPPKLPLPGVNVCIGANGDATAIENKIDRFDTRIAGHYSNTATCPTQIVFTGTSTTGVLDTGWTGLGHDASVVSKGAVTVAVTTCTGDATAPACGVCSYAGPLENGPGELHVRRCSQDSAITCLFDSDCGGGNTCRFYFGSYLPLSAGGISTCVENSFNAGISGTTDLTSGVSVGSANITSRVFTGLLATPCPHCVGDTTANDGIKGGTCSAGLHSGGLCDASGSSPNVQFGTTSLDCPPLVGALVATLPIDLSNTTGNKTRTLSAANPDCSDPSFAGFKCQCDTCNNAAATPCSSNADCVLAGATICGGLRCNQGTNNGAVCSNNTECPGGSCGVPGQATAPNSCNDATCTLVPQCVKGPNDNAACSVDSECPGGSCVGVIAGTPSGNEGTCFAGPFDQACGPVETFRSCTSNAQCTFAGDTCSVGRLRDCYDSGNIGDVVTASGHADPPGGDHISDPTLATLFCVGPTTAGAVNTAAGLPGLGRLELGGHATDNGTL